MPRPSSFSIGDHGECGLSRVELLVLVGLLAVLAGMGWIWTSGWLEQARVNHAVEGARTLNTLLSQYATDNDGVYPTGLGTTAPGKSEGIARNLLANNYAPDAALFAIGAAAKYAGTSPDFTDLTWANVGWDFTGGATASTGIPSTAPDLLPTVFSTGEKVNYPTTAGAGINLSLSGDGPFGKKGMAVAYKGGNAIFIRGTASGADVICPGFISTAFKDTGPYTQIKP